MLPKIVAEFRNVACVYLVVRYCGQRLNAQFLVDRFFIAFPFWPFYRTRRYDAGRPFAVGVGNGRSSTTVKTGPSENAASWFAAIYRSSWYRRRGIK
jgi:hypothetical protein